MKVFAISSTNVVCNHADLVKMRHSNVRFGRKTQANVRFGRCNCPNLLDKEDGKLYNVMCVYYYILLAE